MSLFSFSKDLYSSSAKTAFTVSAIRQPNTGKRRRDREVIKVFVLRIDLECKNVISVRICLCLCEEYAQDQYYHPNDCQNSDEISVLGWVIKRRFKKCFSEKTPIVNLLGFGSGSNSL
jgi:hypothetical protein